MNVQNSRALSIKMSPSMSVSMAAQAMRAAGDEVVDLSLGEPDFDTPPHIVEAAIAAMRGGLTRYTGPAGSEELRAAIVGKFARENGLEYVMDEVAVGNGAKQIIFNVLLATLESGDEVIVPAPYWVSYTDMVRLHGGTPRVVASGVEVGFKMDAARLEAAITPQTRWLFINSPSNPSGAIYSREELAALGEVLTRHPRVLILSDEIYEHIVPQPDSFVSFGSACPQLRERTLLVNGVSKAYAMTGWRLGYAVGPKPLIAALAKMQSQSSTCPSSISQAAAAAALNGPQSFVANARLEYAARAKLVTSVLNAIPGLVAAPPHGAFYTFPECSAFIGKRTRAGELISTDTDLATFLLMSGGVATVPGAAFGLEPYLRLSFATSRNNLRVALAGIAAALATLH
jgi:aspartate aminotransferase